jgi:hypothetical protein
VATPETHCKLNPPPSRPAQHPPPSALGLHVQSTHLLRRCFLLKALPCAGYTTISLLRRFIFIAIASLATLTPQAQGGDGKFEGTDLTLHMFFANKKTREELVGNSETDFSQSWKDYLRQSANVYFDAHEGKSRIKRIYLYNAVPEGKAKADIDVSSYTNPAADPLGLGTSGKFIELPEGYKDTAFISPHHMQTLGHELGHYLYSLWDSYGGQIYDAAGNQLPIEYLSTAAQNRPVTPTGLRPYDLNYREDMWSDQWLRHRASSVKGQTLSGLPAYNGNVFFELSGRLAGGVFPNGSLMSSAFGGAQTRDSEFSIPESHIPAVSYTFKMPAYPYKQRGFFGLSTYTRPADKTPQPPSPASPM